MFPGGACGAEPDDSTTPKVTATNRARSSCAQNAPNASFNRPCGISHTARGQDMRPNSIGPPTTGAMTAIAIPSMAAAPDRDRAVGCNPGTWAQRPPAIRISPRPSSQRCIGLTYSSRRTVPAIPLMCEIPRRCPQDLRALLRCRRQVPGAGAGVRPRTSASLRRSRAGPRHVVREPWSGVVPQAATAGK